MARHCHKAIYHAIEVCGLEPIFLLPPVVEGLGIAGSLTPAQVAQALEDHPGVKLVVYPSPTYDGVVSDTAGICQAAHAKGVPVLVDEAHGAHFGFHPAFPPNAMAQGGGSSSTRSAPPERARAARLHLSVRAHSPRWTQWPLMTHITAVSAPRVRRVRAMCQACPRWKGLYSATIPAVAMG